ncbi:MAG TPA: prepilin-type N-terminal cleavage/methylation domain-containing protein [Victivallales bacterium]|nr:prepilin-type N-terminal cleavage/methylation domain-containing protein [Victivallales bacterium]
MINLTHNKEKFSNDSGFTLLEMLCALFIFTMIMLTVGTGMFIIQQSLKKVDNKSHILNTYLRLDRVFSTCFRNAVPFSWPNESHIEQSTFAGRSDSISFAYIHRIADMNDGGIRFIKLYLTDSKLIAAYRKVPILPWNDVGKELETEVLTDKVSEISFLYADKDTQNNINWKNEWDESLYNKNIPLAIQITITWDDGTIERWLRRTAGSGQYETFGSRRNLR